MTELSLDDFSCEVSCVYDEEEYSVRDNGAVFRHFRPGKSLRPLDNQWTFGKTNNKDGYMYLGKARIHRIVATACHGEPPTPEHIVDHIDTNRRNNRPENLRWLTRLENALLNPITLKRIELICGSVEAFLEDPSKLRHSKFDHNFGWMRNVSKQEAQVCLERMHLWAKSGKQPTGNGSLGEWIFKPSNITEQSSTYIPPEILSDLIMSKTQGAAQRDWNIPTEFPCCPQEVEKDPIKSYAAKLIAGEIFARNHLSMSIILESALVDDGQAICVVCDLKGSMKPWSLAKITFEDGLYIHASLGTFFDEESVEKEFCLARGLEWLGGETWHDLCG